MTYVLLAIIISLGNIMCLFIGINTAQKLIKNEDVKLPNLNPIEMVEDYKKSKKIEEENSKFNIIMNNIDNYDGTGANQKEVK